jgi:hypothetical protein
MGFCLSLCSLHSDCSNPCLCPLLLSCCYCYRWDIMKPASVSEARALPPSPKIVRAIVEARRRGLHWLWVDWCTVPQYSSAGEEVLNHVRASRFVYERCTLLLADLVEIEPGLRVPTPDYVGRLWTTAEMSSTLVNPEVKYGTFVKLERFNHRTMIIATGQQSATSELWDPSEPECLTPTLFVSL